MATSSATRSHARPSLTSARTTITPTYSATAHLDVEAPPAFLELVGRLTAACCPPLLSTDVVRVARSALVGHAESEMHEVEAVARAALDVVVVRPTDRTARDERQP
jgi:hypothetical protein